MDEDKKNQLLIAARSVFLRYGFKRVRMADIAGAAGISRPALYIVFKNKEDIFIGVYLQWVDETIAEIGKAMASAATAQEEIERAFEIWSVKPFELVLALPDASELVECTFGFAQAAVGDSYAKIEAAILPAVARLVTAQATRTHLTPARIAHIFASAVRGFKQSATTPDELRRLISELSILMFGEGRQIENPSAWPS